MTDQERPIEERNELLDDLLNAASVAVEDAETCKQESSVADEPPEPAAQLTAPDDTADRNATSTALPSEGVEVVVPTSETPLEAAPLIAPAEETVTPPASEEGASYTPVAEDESGRPRRVKDLEPGMEIEGRVTSIALYGIFVDIGVGRDGLVHISEMSDMRIESPSDLVQIGDSIKVRVKSVEPDGRRISLTMRSKEQSSERRGRKKPEINHDVLTALRVGENIEGKVTGIAPFGVFVDIGVGKDGLVHVSELAEGRIEKPEDAVQVGQTYTFKILEVDADGARISLSLRRAQRSQRMNQLEKGQILDGTISGLAPFGAFVDIGVGRDGLIHISELAEGRVGKVEDVVKVGDKVKVRIIEIDQQSKRISLSMLLEDRPREESPAGTDATEPREERGWRSEHVQRDERGSRGARQEAAADHRVESAEPDETGEEEEVGNATLEDLLSRFGGNKRDRKRRQDEEEEEEETDRYTRRQRDAIRRTLQQMSDDE